jgi:hypothetical protein
MAFLTDSAQKAYSKLIASINTHKMTIDKCKKYAEECPSDKVKRCKEGILYHKKQVEAHDAIVAERVRKVMEEGAKDKEKKLQYLRDAEEKLENELSMKTRAQVSAETEIEKLEKELKQLLEINAPPKIPEAAPKIPEAPPKIPEAPPKISEWDQMQKDEKELEALRATRPSNTVDYSIPKTSTVYGPVSTLPPRSKIGVKVVPKKVINANTNVYPDTVLE